LLWAFLNTFFQVKKVFDNKHENEFLIRTKVIQRVRQRNVEFVTSFTDSYFFWLDCKKIQHEIQIFFVLYVNKGFKHIVGTINSLLAKYNFFSSPKTSNSFHTKRYEVLINYWRNFETKLGGIKITVFDRACVWKTSGRPSWMSVFELLRKKSYFSFLPSCLIPNSFSRRNFRKT
jgi:hypothetical protein